MTSKIRIHIGLSTSVLVLGACGVNDDVVAQEAQQLDAEIEVAGNEIINGSSTWTGKELIRNRTASIYNAGCPNFVPGTSASGTFLNRYVVLTAKHVVTNDCSMTGTVVSPGDVRVRIGAMAPAPGGTDICVGSTRTTDCSVAQKITVLADRDLAIIELDNRIIPVGALTGFYPFTPIPLWFSLAQNTYMPSNSRLITGWGQTTCNGPDGLRWGLVDVTVAASTSNNLELHPKVPEGQMISFGDSGGPTWADNLAGSPQIGIHSVSWGCSSPHVAEDVSLLNEAAVESIHSLLDDYRFDYPVPNDPSYYQIIDVDSVGAAPSWVTNTVGRLEQVNNAGPDIAIIKDRAVHFFDDLDADVTVQGSDNDSSGLVVSYTDPQNFVACYADDQNNVAKLVAVRAGVETVLQSKPWNGIYSNDVNFHLQTRLTQSFAMQCKITGGGAADVTLNAGASLFASGPFGGMVGIYNNFNQVNHRDIHVAMTN